jgi:hypothetical protein
MRNGNRILIEILSRLFAASVVYHSHDLVTPSVYKLWPHLLRGIWLLTKQQSEFFFLIFNNRLQHKIVFAFNFVLQRSVCLSVSLSLSLSLSLYSTQTSSGSQLVSYPMSTRNYCYGGKADGA